MKRIPCNKCGKTNYKALYYFRWHSGIIPVNGKLKSIITEKYICSACVRKGDSPPINEVKRSGGEVLKYEIFE